jgi:hypothetical protein
MFNILHALKTGQTNGRSQPRKRPRYVPRLECLEDRLAPSVSQARILISPLTATKVVNQAQTLTAEVDVSTDGITWTPEANAPVTFSFVPPPSGRYPFFVGGVNSGITNGSGQVSVQINSGSGIFTIQATTTFTIAGGTFSATTGTGSPNSANATITYIGLVPSINDDVSLVGDPSFLDFSVTNASTVPLFLETITDSVPTFSRQVLLGNLLNAPASPITSISAEINGVLVPPANFKAGLSLPAGETLDVLLVRTVQATDPFPVSLFLSTFGFNSVQDGSGTAISATVSNTVTIFHPSVKIGLTVDKTTASVGDRLTYNVTVTNTSTTNSPNLVANFQTGNLSNVLISGMSRGRVTGLTSTSHMFVGEFVFGPGLRPNSKILAINAALGQVTLNKSIPTAQLGTSPELFFGFGPAIIGGVQQPFVPPPSDFFTNNPALVAELESFAPRLATALPFPTVTFSYTHVVHSGDPKPLKNTLDMFFFVSNSELHPVAWPNKIHGPSVTVTTAPLSLKMLF